MSTDADVRAEQNYLTMLHGRLDAVRERASHRLATTLNSSGTSHQGRSERDSLAGRYAQEFAELGAVSDGLYFGRLDFEDAEIRRIGRIGLFDEDNDYEPLLIDWRAPAARAFYLATAAAPDGVRRRRHIRTRMREVTSLQDEVLDLSSERAASDLVGEAALLAALNASRTGRMRDIVETIQAEQDRIIRSDPSGVLVVAGGPGTGKTAVALHRAAYLLYTYRQRLSTQGVLVVGPNETFLRYIGQVLPSLAETGVLLATPGDLFPGVRARGTEPADLASRKGNRAMAAVITAAVRDRQEVPDEGFTVTVSDQHAGFGYQRETITLDKESCERARDLARATGRAHNLARPAFVDAMLDALAWQVAQAAGTDPYADDPLGGNDAPGEGALLLGSGDVAAVRADLAVDAEVAAALSRMWPSLTAEELLRDLYADPERLASAGAPAEFLRTPDRPFTPADVPLLDEAAELLGIDNRADRERADRERLMRIRYAEDVLNIVESSQLTDLEDDSEAALVAADVIDAERLAERQAERIALTAAQRGALDRAWAWGHIIVDEAQELSPMTWRLLMRRCPSRSMTVVGDLAQAGELGGGASWNEIFGPYVADRWRLAELTVNYRTPAELMAVAEPILAEIDPTARAPRSVRHTGVCAQAIPIPAAQLLDSLLAPAVPASPDQLAGALAERIKEEVALLGEGRLGVLLPSRLAGAVGEVEDLTAQVAILTVRDTKGLEFDSVLVVDPAGIVAESPRGLNDLYVALTRATQRLGVVYPDR